MDHKFDKKEINNKIEYFVDGQMIDRFHLLAAALHTKNKKDAWEIMHIASRFISCTR